MAKAAGRKGSAMIIEKLMKQADFTDVEKSIAAYLMKNGFDVKICPFSPWRVRLFRRRLRLQDFVESWDWMDIKISDSVLFRI